MRQRWGYWISRSRFFVHVAYRNVHIMSNASLTYNDLQISACDNCRTNFSDWTMPEENNQTHVFFPERSEHPWSLYSVTLTFNNSGSLDSTTIRTAHADSTCRATWGFSSGFSSSFWICSTVTSPGEFFKTQVFFPPPFCWGKTAGWQTRTRTPKNRCDFV